MAPNDLQLPIIIPLCGFQISIWIGHGSSGNTKVLYIGKSSLGMPFDTAIPFKKKKKSLV